MSDDQWLCWKMFGDLMGGFHHVGEKPKPCGKGIEINEPTRSWSTFDGDLLTRVVIMAHDRAIRVEISGGGPAVLRICLHRRGKREGRLYERHPTMQDAILGVVRPKIGEGENDGSL